MAGKCRNRTYQPPCEGLSGFEDRARHQSRTLPCELGTPTPSPRLPRRSGGLSDTPRSTSELVMARINFVELPAGDIALSKSFYASVFGWDLADFGPSYSCTLTGDVDLGLQGDLAEATKAPLAVIAVDDLDQALAAVEQAGGTITKPIFAFPGGRRFHFLDPSGNELAALKVDSTE